MKCSIVSITTDVSVSSAEQVAKIRLQKSRMVIGKGGNVAIKSGAPAGGCCAATNLPSTAAVPPLGFTLATSQPRGCVSRQSGGDQAIDFSWQLADGGLLQVARAVA